MKALAAHLRELPPRRTVLLFGAMSDKDHHAMLSPLDGLVDAYVYAVPTMRRAPDPSVFAEIVPGEVAPTVERGLSLAKEQAGRDGRVVVAGSIFVINAARPPTWVPHRSTHRHVTTRSSPAAAWPTRVAFPVAVAVG